MVKGFWVYIIVKDCIVDYVGLRVCICFFLIGYCFEFGFVGGILWDCDLFVVV